MTRNDQTHLDAWLREKCGDHGFEKKGSGLHSQFNRDGVLDEELVADGHVIPAGARYCIFAKPETVGKVVCTFFLDDRQLSYRNKKVVVKMFEGTSSTV